MPNALHDPVRLQEARRVQPVDPARRRVLNRLVALAAELADAPAALLTIVEDRRQVFAAQFGLPEELAEAGETSIEYSICQYAVASGKPLIVENMAEHGAFRCHPAAEVLGVASYAGMPVVTSSGCILGTLCVIDFQPRDWSDDVLARMAFLAELAADEFDLQSLERVEAFRETWRAIPENPRW